MKRSIILFLAAAFAVACAEEVKVPFELDSDEIHVGPEGGMRTIRLSVGEPWTAMTNEPWIAVSPANGKGSEDCLVMIDSTIVNGMRDDVVRIQTESGKYKEFTVVQDGFSHQINISNPLVEIKDFDVLDKRKFDVVVNTNVDFEVVIPEEHSWLTCRKPSDVDKILDRGARPRNVTVAFEWKVNPTSDMRNVDVKFMAKNVDGEVKADVLKVSQGNAPDIESFKGTPAGDSLALLSISRFLGCWSEFDTGVKMERWEGVTIHKTGKNKGRVKSAQFVFFETDESIPYAVKYLTAAEELYFFSNVNSFRKSLSLGDDICTLTELKRLTVFAYGLTELSDNISQMKNLRYLDLSGNNFSSVPKGLKDCESLKALFLTSNQRSVIADLSNSIKKDIGGLVDECPEDGSGNRKFPKWLLEWDQLDTLRLSVNYLQGTLPTDEELINDGFKAWDVNSFDPESSEVNIKDSLGTEGIKFFTENRVPMVLPDIDFFAINLNKLHGDIPNWLKYHPKLDYWFPLLLVFPQEGKDAAGNVAGFNNVPTNLNYYYEIYKNKKWSESNIVN
ncbi:MAG: hypothetical protein E7123_07285 [Bacteroidales bacterium]|nr:hypothetical protein [Bacteroidales bacterium]